MRDNIPYYLFFRQGTRWNNQHESPLQKILCLQSVVSLKKNKCQCKGRMRFIDWFIEQPSNIQRNIAARIRTTHQIVLRIPREKKYVVDFVKLVNACKMTDAERTSIIKAYKPRSPSPSSRKSPLWLKYPDGRRVRTRTRSKASESSKQSKRSKRSPSKRDRSPDWLRYPDGPPYMDALLKVDAFNHRRVR